MANKTATLLPAGLDDSIEDVYSTEFISESDEITAAEKLANAAIEELSDTAERGKSIKIYRQTGDGQSSREFIMSHPADKYTIDELILMVQREYGGGNYRFMVYNERGKISANKLICIALKINPEVENGGDSMAGVFSQYMNKQDRLLESLLNGNTNKGDDRASFMREMLMMKQLFGSEKNAPAPPIISPVDSMKEMFTLMAMVKEQAAPEPSETEGGGFAEIMSQSLPLLTEIIKAGKNPPQNNGPQARPNTGRRNTAEKRTQNNQQGKTENPMINQIANELLKEAQLNSDASEVAQKMCDKVPEAFADKFIEFLSDEKLLIHLCEKAPQLSQFEDWLKNVLEWSKWIMGEPSKFDGAQDDELTGAKETNNIDGNQTEKAKNVKSSNDGDSKR